MSLYNVLTLIAAIANSLLGLLVYLRKPHDYLHRLFAIFAVVTSAWVMSNLLFFISPNELLMRSQYAFGAVVLISFFFWVDSFSKTNVPKWEKVIILFLAIIFFSLPFLGGLIIEDVNGFILKAGPLFNTFSTLLNLVFLILLVRLIALYIRLDSKKKSQVGYILLGVVGFGSISMGFSFVVPYFGHTPVSSIDAQSSILFVGFTAYAIVKHRLMDIKALFFKSVAYTISLFVVVAGYVALTVFVFNKLGNIINPTVLNIFTLLVLVFTFNPLVKYIQKKTDRIFSKNRYDFNDLLGTFNNIAKENSRSIKNLTANVLNALTEEMRINKAAFILTNSPTPSTIEIKGFSSKAKSIWSKPIKIVFDAGKTVVYDELDDGNVEKEVLMNSEIEVLIPIKTDRDTEGVIALGEKSSGDMYTAEDLKLLELVAPQIAIALENAKSFKEKEQRIHELKSINRMFRHIEHFIDIDKLLQKIVQEAIDVTGAEGGSIMLLSKNKKHLTIKTSIDLDAEISLDTKIMVGEGISGKVALSKKPIIVHGLNSNKHASDLKREEVHSAISVPMMSGDKLIGVLNVNRRKTKVEFSKENLNIISAFAAQAAEAIVKAGYYHQVELLSIKNDNQFKEFTKALSKTVDAKDPYTYGHSEAVTNYAIEIAKEMKVDKDKIRTIEIGGRLHDMGKIGIPEHILNKPSGLSDEEYKIIQRHPEIGARILQGTTSLNNIRDLILYHHERYDGRGYPSKLAGKQIPFLARIMAVADTYDAMTSHRAYRKALPRSIAVAEIKKCSGAQFDPDVVEAFLKVMNSKRFKLIQNNIEQTVYAEEVPKFELEEG